MSSLVHCPHCRTRVLPMAGRRCPACGQDVDAPPSQPAPERVAEVAYGQAAEQISQGADPSMVRADLARRGLDGDSADAIVDQLKRAQAVAKRAAARSHMFYGACWCIGGIAVTALTYRAAADAGGGSYVIAWGAILFGAIQFLRGLTEASAG